MKKDYEKKYTTEELKEKLTPEQFEVTQNEGTEAPFKNEYWDNTEKGLYVDIVSGEPLFTSMQKFESSCGWPSFDATIIKKITNFLELVLKLEQKEAIFI